MTDDARPVWVLGGGGVTGIAWEVGVLAGLADEGVTVTPEAVLIGTSSGAVVGAQLTSGRPLGELYERQRQGVAHETSNALGTAPVTIDGHRYMDGGMRSTVNLDLAPGIGPVVALAPSTAAIGPWARRRIPQEHLHPAAPAQCGPLLRDRRKVKKQWAA